MIGCQVSRAVTNPLRKAFFERRCPKWIDTEIEKKTVYDLNAQMGMPSGFPMYGRAEQRGRPMARVSIGIEELFDLDGLRENMSSSNVLEALHQIYTRGWLNTF